MSRLFILSLFAGLMPAMAGCSVAGNALSSVTGIEIKPTYSQEQKAALRASLTLSMNNLSNGAFQLTEAEWIDTYNSVANLCEYLNDNGREETIKNASDFLLQESPSANSFAVRQFASAYVNAATSQGSFCPGIA